MRRDRAFAGVVRRKSERKAPGVMVDESRKLANPAAHVLLRIEWIVNVESRCGCRHELHETQSTLAADRHRVVVRLDPNQGIDQCRIETMLTTDIGDQPLEKTTIEAEASPARPSRRFSGPDDRRSGHKQGTRNKEDHSPHRPELYLIPKPAVQQCLQSEPAGRYSGPMTTARRDALVRLMTEAGMPDAAIRTFLLHYQRLEGGERGLLHGHSIRPLEDLPNAGTLAGHRGSGRRALDRTVVLKLNGGLGTSMGLERAKSLLSVREGLSFLDLICRQVLAFRHSLGARIPLILMNSFRTEADSREVLSRYPELAHDEIPHSFLQHQIPKVLAETLEAASSLSEGEQAWCPPGHGDLYTALTTTGLLERLIAAGFEYAFVSNADNLGALPDPDLLGFMVDQRIDLLVEAAERTPADRKGGHLCRLADGRLALREFAQCPPDEAEEFQDVERFRYFNTNNLWLHLPSLQRLLREHRDVLPLPTIVNHKYLDPRDPSSPKVVQLETAMGAAVAVFPHAAAVHVPRRRFSPVKTTSDLLAVRSDAYLLRNDGSVTLVPDRERPPTVRLDPAWYRLIDEFDRRFPSGPPSLRACDALTVEGDVTFGAGVVVRGSAVVVAASGPAGIADGTVVEGRYVAPPL